MNRLIEIRVTSAGIAAILALFVTAATPNKKQIEAIVVGVAEIDRESVHARTSKDQTGATLSFLLRDKDPQQARTFFFTNSTRRVRIMDGVTLIADAQLSGVVMQQSKKKGGLILWFESLEEANQVAAELRPFLK